MTEVLVAYAYNTKDLVRHVQLGVTGLTSHVLETNLDISGAISRARATPRSIATPPPGAHPTDHEVLSAAVLVAAGDGEPDRARTDLSHLRAEAARLAHLARDLRSAMTTGDRPAKAFGRFSEWILDDYLGAVADLEAQVDEWLDSYVLTRQRVAPSAAAYTSWLAAAVSRGEAAEVPAAEAREALARYLQVDVRAGEFSEYPRLGGDPTSHNAATK
jgi:hypothetical protein